MTQWTESQSLEALDAYLNSDEGQRFFALFSDEKVMSLDVFKRDAARRIGSDDAGVTAWWAALTAPIQNDDPRFLSIVEAFAQRGKDIEEVFYSLPDEYDPMALNQALDFESGSQTARVGISNTTEWTRDQYHARLDELCSQLGLAQASPDIQHWWNNIKDRNESPAPLLRLAEELAIRKSSLSEFYQVRQITQSENIMANLAYLDYSRLKGIGQNDKWWKMAATGMTRIKGWTDDQIKTRLIEVKQKLRLAQCADIARQWWDQVEQENSLPSVLRLAEELSKRHANLTQFYQAWQDAQTNNFQAALYYFDYLSRARKVESGNFDFSTITLDQRGIEIERQQLQANQFIEELAPDINLEMVSIPGGTFTMGSDEKAVEQAFAEAKRYNKDAEREWFTRELPQHKVTLSPFYLGKFTITQEQWRVIAADKTLKAARELEPDPARFKGQDRPVENVSWEDAEEFCARLAKKTGRAYRLPTEAEWEYACRAGTTTPFAFGETITPDVVNYNGGYPYAEAPKGKYRSETIPVGSLGVANAFGLFDMHGNVWEWCQDWYGKYEGKDLIDPTGVKSGERRVLRGGSYLYNARICRAAYRLNLTPAYRYYYIGFRCVISARTL